jgi:hypothetical protein
MVAKAYSSENKVAGEVLEDMLGSARCWYREGKMVIRTEKT